MAEAVPVADLYRGDQPARPDLLDLSAVDDAAVARFHEQGYLVVRQALTAEEVAAALEAIDQLIERSEPGGSIDVVQYEPTAPAEVAERPPAQRRDQVRKLFRFVQHSPPLQALVTHPALLGAIERLMGAAPVLFQDMALLKPPGIGSEKPWHQDCAYFNLPPDTCVVGAWIALDEATPDNGCMHVIPGSHRGGPRVHWQRRDWQLCDTDVPVEHDHVVPLPPGGVLLFHGLLWHGTPPNRSVARRRALQYHYRPAEVAFTEPAARLAVFGSEGKDVSC